MRALVIDDNESVAKATVMYLKSRGIEAELVFAPDEAIRMLAEGSYDVVISDLEMKHSLTGLDVLAAAKEYQPLARRVLTSGADKPNALDPEVPFVQKPASLGEIDLAIGLDRPSKLV